MCAYPREFNVIPAQAGIQEGGTERGSLDTGFRRYDEEQETQLIVIPA